MVEWKINGIFKADAEKVYEEITSIGDEVTPEQIVDFARDKDTELHKCFLWDNKKAAEKYRLSQAQSIIRNISIIIDYNDENGKEQQVTVRAITCTNERKNTYQTIQKCIENPDSFARLKATMMKDLRIFKERYERYSQIKDEFIDLFNAVDSVIQIE